MGRIFLVNEVESKQIRVKNCQSQKEVRSQELLGSDSEVDCSRCERVAMPPFFSSLTRLCQGL